MTEHTIMDALKSCYKEHDNVFVRCAIWCELQDMLAPIFRDGTGYRNAIEAAVAHVGGTSSLGKKRNKTLITDPALLATIGT